MLKTYSSQPERRREVVSNGFSPMLRYHYSKFVGPCIPLGRGPSLAGKLRGSARNRGMESAACYLLQPFFVSSNPSNRRPALASARVAIRCGWPFSTV